MSNSIDLMVTGVPTILNHMKQRTVNVLALTSHTRWPGAENVPTVMEQGLNIASYSSYGLMAPKGTPPAVLDYLYQQTVNVLKEPAMKAALDAQGVQGIAISPTELGNSLGEETRLWARVVRTAKIKVD